MLFRWGMLGLEKIAGKISTPQCRIVSSLSSEDNDDDDVGGGKCGAGVSTYYIPAMIQETRVEEPGQSTGLVVVVVAACQNI
jgi:hypothetical protein